MKCHTADLIRDLIRIRIVTPDSIRIRFERKRLIRRSLELLVLHLFNSLFSRTTWVQKGKTSLDLHEARNYGVLRWQWHQLDHMHLCTSLQTDNHTNTPAHDFYRPDVLPDAQSTLSGLLPLLIRYFCFKLLG